MKTSKPFILVNTMRKTVKQVALMIPFAQLLNSILIIKNVSTGMEKSPQMVSLVRSIGVT